MILDRVITSTREREREVSLLLKLCPVIETYLSF